MKSFLDDKSLKENAFKVPQGYFETLTERTLANVGIEASKDLVKPVVRRSLVPLWSSIAASVIVALTVGWYIISEVKTSVISEKYYLAIENSIQDYSINTITLFIDSEDDDYDYDISESGLWYSEIDESILLEVEQE